MPTFPGRARRAQPRPVRQTPPSRGLRPNQRTPATQPRGPGQVLEAGRIALNEKAGNLTSADAKPLFSQLNSIHQQILADKQANGGTLSPGDAQTISQRQDQLSKQIYDAAR